MILIALNKTLLKIFSKLERNFGKVFFYLSDFSCMVCCHWKMELKQTSLLHFFVKCLLKFDV